MRLETGNSKLAAAPFHETGERVVIPLNVEVSQYIETRTARTCLICGSRGHLLYRGLKDAIYEVPGSWSIRRCVNGGCGLLWLDPRPVPGDVGKLYGSYHTHRDPPNPHPTRLRKLYQTLMKGYLRRRYGYFKGRAHAAGTAVGTISYLWPGMRALFDIRAMHLNAMPGGRLLEVGCGGGGMLREMAALGWRAEGVEIDPVAAENARAKGLKVFCGTLFQGKYPENGFDAVVMIHVLEHVPDPLELAAECFRILKPEGQLVIVTPNARSWGHRIYGSCHRPLEIPRHLQVFTPASLLASVGRMPFSKVKSFTTMRDAWQFIGSRAIRRKGRVDLCARPSAALMVWAGLMQWLEWALLKFDPSIGEEIVFIGEK